MIQVDQRTNGPESTTGEKICLLDMDGTVADYTGQLEKDLERLRSPNEPEFDMNHDTKYPEYLQNRIDMIKNSKDWWLNLPRLEDGFDLVKSAIGVGFEIHVLTKGPRTTKTAWTQKVEWCAKHLPPNVGVTITQDKSLVYGRILIDDYPDYMLSWLDKRPRGLGIMPLRPWNKDFKHPQVIHYNGEAPSRIKAIEKMIEQFER